MAHLQTLAARFVEQDGLSTEEQDHIITKAADCQLSHAPLNTSFGPGLIP